MTQISLQHKNNSRISEDSHRPSRLLKQTWLLADIGSFMHSVILPFGANRFRLPDCRYCSVTIRVQRVTGLLRHDGPQTTHTDCQYPQPSGGKTSARHVNATDDSNETKHDEQRKRMDDNMSVSRTESWWIFERSQHSDARRNAADK